jgi:glycosyltransferase involved in cell wall biosynthesis
MDHRHAWDLVLLGDGELRAQVQRKILQLGISDAVWLPGFQQYGNLPGVYGLAGAFVHASTVEQWGLVVNEAMAAGLPVLVSDRCGCVPDLVQYGVNGFTFDPYDVEALANLMFHVSSDACDRAAMGRASQSIISQWTPEVFALNLELAVEAARSAPRLKARSLDRAALWFLTHR